MVVLKGWGEEIPLLRCYEIEESMARLSSRKLPAWDGWGGSSHLMGSVCLSVPNGDYQGGCIPEDARKGGK